MILLVVGIVGRFWVVEVLIAGYGGRCRGSNVYNLQLLSEAICCLLSTASQSRNKTVE